MKEERMLYILGEIDEKYIAEAAPDRKGRQTTILKIRMLIAACLALLLALTAAAYATNWFGLRDLLLPLIGESSQNGNGGRISLTGYQGSPEWKALAEWQAFVNEYDPDGSIYQNTSGQLDSSLARYSCYTVYSREMADKLDEIAAKYGLKLHTTSYNLQEHPELLELLGNFLGDKGGYYTYMYEDGTFQADGTIDFEEIGAWDFRLLRSVRGTFHDAMLDIGDVSEYQEVSYETACGVTVTLALSKSQALILADLKDSFVTVYISHDSNSSFKQSHLEILADRINFAALTPVVKPQSSDTTQHVERDAEARKVYAAALRNLLYSNTLPNGTQTEMPVSAASQFTVADVDADRKEELVLLIESENSVGYIIGYNPETKNIYIQLEEFPAFTFLKNGNLKVLSSHNQTRGEMWPYILYQYLPESDSYELRGYVYSEDKTFFEENDLMEHDSEYADISGSGTVYYAGTDAWGTTPMDEAAYIAWLKANSGTAAELEVGYVALTEENILTIFSQNDI